MKVCFGIYLLIFVLSQGLFSQISDNVELRKMYEEDQASRLVPKIDWVNLTKCDKLREKRVYELIDSNKVVTGLDYYHSAMIFQHGADSIAYRMAVKQMKKAVELDSTINKWLLAAAIDRELMSRKKPQVYGTQYIKNVQTGKFTLYLIDTTLVTDEERKSYGVETLAEQRISERNMNLCPITEFYAETKSLKKTINFIKAEKLKGIESAYNVSEEAINSFGFELLNSKKAKEALAIFELNTKLYPDKYNTFDSLGECLLILGKKDKAIKAYRKSLDLNPKNETARRILKGN